MNELENAKHGGSDTTPLVCAGFTEHPGGVPPVEPGMTVDVLHRDGSISEGRVIQAYERWVHLGTPCDIVGYRVQST